LWEITHETIDHRKITLKKKNVFHAAVDTIAEKITMNKSVKTCSKVHVKKEVVFGKPWPRMIAAREDGLRSVSAVLYERVAK